MSTKSQFEPETAKNSGTGTPSFLITICKTDVINHLRAGYEKWRDYAVYHNQNNGEKATKILNEVIYDVLQDPAEHLSELLYTTAGQYTELDMLVLKVIKDRSTNNLKN
jgi:hypothetical protein